MYLSHYLLDTSDRGLNDTLAQLFVEMIDAPDNRLSIW